MTAVFASSAVTLAGAMPAWRHFVPGAHRLMLALGDLAALFLQLDASCRPGANPGYFGAVVFDRVRHFADARQRTAATTPSRRRGSWALAWPF